MSGSHSNSVQAQGSGGTGSGKGTPSHGAVSGNLLSGNQAGGQSRRERPALGSNEAERLIANFDAKKAKNAQTPGFGNGGKSERETVTVERKTVEGNVKEGKALELDP